MMEREKVIKGLESFKADLKPFAGNHADWAKVDNAIALLKAQGPRVLTLNEIPEYDGAVFIEYVDDAGEWALYVPEGAPYFAFMTSKGGRWMSPGDYERTWRAWTGRPTAEQRWQK